MTYAIIQYPAVAGSFAPMRSRRIDMLVMHATGGVKAGDLWTLSGRDRRHLVSCHYYITKLGEIYQLVQDKDIAWHAGVSFWQGESDCNRFSLGVELENLNTGTDPYPQAQLDAAIWLVRQKVQQHQIPQSRLVKHAQVAQPPGRKSDPRGFPWESFVGQIYAPPLKRMRVRFNDTWVRTGPSITKADRVDFGHGPISLAAGRIITVAPATVTGERHTHRTLGTSDQWWHWIEQKADGSVVEPGFIWAPQLEDA